MPDDKKEPNGLDAILGKEEQEILDRLAGQTQPPAENEQQADDEQKVEGAADESARSAEEIAAEEAAATEAARVAAEAEAEKNKEKDIGSKGPTWAEFRDAQRKAKELEDENTRLREQREQQDQADQQDRQQDDPIDKVNADIAALKARQDQLTEAERLRLISLEIANEETVFAKDHPDYVDSLRHIVAVQRQEFELSGAIPTISQRLVADRGEQIAAMLRNEGNYDPSLAQIQQRAADLAFGQLFEGRRQQFIQGVKHRGGNVAEAAWKLAEHYGYKSGHAAEAAKEQQATAAQQRVDRAKEVVAATQSLSAIQKGGAPRPEITSRKQLLDMNFTEQEKYIARMDSQDPDWLEKLSD